MAKQMECIASEARELPGFGIFEPGQVTEFNEVLFATGIFKPVEPKQKGSED